MRTLVLGGTYFIGKVLTQKLLKAGNYEVTLLNRGTKEQEIESLPINLIKVDRTDAEGMRKALSNRIFDIVFDLSGYNERDVNLAVSVLKGQVGQYIFCSSVAVCRQPPDFWPFTEDHPKCISVEDGEYGFDKWQAESFLWNEHQKGELNVTVVRPVYVYGPGDYKRRVNYIFEKIESHSPVIIRGNGDNIIQFGYVDDLAEAMITCINNEKAYGEVFNISGKELVTVRQFIENIARSINKKVEIICLDKTTGVEKEISSLPEVHRFANISKIKEILGIVPRFSLEEGIRKITQCWTRKEE